MLSELPGDDAAVVVPPSKSEISIFVDALGRALRKRNLKIAYLNVVPGDVRS